MANQIIMLLGKTLVVSGASIVILVMIWSFSKHIIKEGKKKTGIAIFLIGSMFLLGFYLIWNRVFHQPGYFSYKSCEDSKGDKGWSGSITTAKWAGDNLTITTPVIANCGALNIAGKRKIKGDKIILSVEPVENTLLTAMCVCDFESTFNLKNLPKKDYQIILMENGQEADQLLLRENGKISDYCDHDRSFECYSKKIAGMGKGKYEGYYEEYFGIYEDDEITEESDAKAVIDVSQIKYDTKENKQIAESKPDFLELFLKYEPQENIMDPNDTIYLYFDEDAIMIRTFEGESDDDGYAETGLVSNVLTFEEGIEKYVQEKKKREAAGSFQDQLQKRLGIEGIIAHPNEGGFSFDHNGEIVDYRGAGKSAMAGYLRFEDRDGLDHFKFLNGAPKTSQIKREELFELISIAEKITENLKENKDGLSKWGMIHVRPDQSKARFRAEANIEKESRTLYGTIHNFNLPYKIPVEKNFELNYETGELRVLADGENVQEF